MTSIDARPRSVSPRTVLAVAGHELRSRRAAPWWRRIRHWALGCGVLTLVVAALTHGTLGPGGHDGPPPTGRVVFGIVTLLALTVSTVVAAGVSAPMLSPVHDERIQRIAARTPRPERVASATAAEQVGGALLAAWAAAAGTFAAAVPSLAATLVLGHVPGTALLTVPLVSGLLLATVCAIGLAASATSRSPDSARHRAGGAVVALFLGGIVAFVLTLGLVTETRRVPPPASACTPTAGHGVVTHSERTWWLLAPSPLVVVSDVAFPPDRTVRLDGSDPLSSIRDAVRTARSEPGARRLVCAGDGPFLAPADQESIDRAVVWPWGLAANLVLGAAATAVAVRRLASR